VRVTGRIERAGYDGHGVSTVLPAVVVVMGVSGSGKTTVGALLARLLDWELADADAFHPDANVEKMREGIALTDEDRWPWLQAIAAWIDATRRAGRHGVVACSALRRSYRDILIDARDDVRLVYLKGDPELIGQRMARRHGHFMSTALLQSQFDALEEPGPDENPIIVSIDADPSAIAARILAELRIEVRAP
jgi:carbohydrate kinase (thermoresistant glucokinase family)